MKIIVDDKREVKVTTGFQIARTYSEAILWVDVSKSVGIEFISLDYDLGDNQYNGLSILVYMFENTIIPQRINIHSDHPTGVKSMKEYCEKNFGNVKLTQNAL